MADNNKSTNLGFGGGVIGVAGGVMCYIGKHMNSDMERQLTSYWNTGNKDGTGDILFYIGVALIIIGLIMIVVNIVQYYQPSENTGSVNSEENNENENRPMYCKKCDSPISFGNIYCPVCNEKIDWSLYNEIKKSVKEKTNNNWKCKNCGRINYNYVGTCGCGVTKEENNRIQTSYEAESDKYCPICNTRIEFGMFACPNCKNRIDWSKILDEKTVNRIIETKHDSTEENNQRFCTNCGEKIIAGNKFCGSCGAKIE